MEYTYKDNLESGRLLTRFLTREDARWWLEFIQNKQAIEFFLPSDVSAIAFSEEWMERQLTRYQQKRYGLQVLIEKSTGKAVGQCGLLLQEVDNIPELEVGYHILPQYWGMGYAPEAAKCFIDYAFENNFSNSVISIIDIRNRKSQRVAEKNGLIREKQTVWSNLNVYIYRKLK